MAKPPRTFETAFDTYKVEGLIGEGGSGMVFAVVDAEGNRRALKCLSPQLSDSQKSRRFKNEIHFCTKDTHRNIVKILDSGAAEWDGKKVPFYVMPHYAGTLRHLMKAKIPAARVLQVFAQVLDGVEAAHYLKVTHRDLKPENILYDKESDRLIVADFGIAHFEAEAILTAVETKKADKLANLRYAAPEQCVRNAVVDHHADIYALGLILNEMYTGVTPRGTGYATIASVAPDASYLDALVERMIQQAPSSRPATIGEVKSELIGRKNEFVALQELDVTRREVVPVASAGQVEPVRVIGKDWQQGKLIFHLNRTPEPAWVNRFRNPRVSWSGVMGAGPQNFFFTGDKASVPANDMVVEKIVVNFNQYLEMATRGYQEELDQAAKRADFENREKLKKDLAEREQRASILKVLNKT